ncbi:MAG: ATP-binding protein [Candidatus Melainabacteria bacterium]|nr:ATP-binding protein [Candidatus Melainabacteria bacterium]
MGKTSVLQELERRGYNWIPEAKLAKVGKIDGIRTDEGAFQRQLYMSRCNIESILNPDELILFDGALPDSITYFRIARLDPAAIIESCKRFRYHRVFIFEPLKFEWDGVRLEMDEISLFLDLHLEIDYRELGYDVIRIPALSVEKRIELILSALN